MSAGRILILDDDPVARDIFARILAAEGYDVRAAATAREAIEAGGEFAPQVLISDWMLKEELDGLDVARRLKEEHPDLLIYFVTGLPADHLLNQLNGLPIARIYEKPMLFGPLLAEIQSALAQVVVD